MHRPGSRQSRLGSNLTAIVFLSHLTVSSSLRGLSLRTVTNQEPTDDDYKVQGRHLRLHWPSQPFAMGDVGLWVPGKASHLVHSQMPAIVGVGAGQG